MVTRSEGVVFPSGCRQIPLGDPNTRGWEIVIAEMSSIAWPDAEIRHFPMFSPGLSFSHAVKNRTCANFGHDRGSYLPCNRLPLAGECYHLGQRVSLWCELPGDL